MGKEEKEKSSCIANPMIRINSILWRRISNRSLHSSNKKKIVKIRAWNLDLCQFRIAAFDREVIELRNIHTYNIYIVL